MSTATLTSLAILKVSIDRRRDYLSYLRPFVLHVLANSTPEPVTDELVRNRILDEFGLDLPKRTIQILLKRLSRRREIKKIHGRYSVTDKLSDPRINEKQEIAQNHIDMVVTGLMEYSSKNSKSALTHEDAVTAICSFLSKFDISCLRAYLRATTIPSISAKESKHIILVSEYAIHLQRNNLTIFESFMVMVQGHMLANAMLCPDLHDAPKHYRNVTFYLDTPLVLMRIGVDGPSMRDAVRELTDLVRNLGGKIRVFRHTVDEAKSVLHYAIKNFELGVPRNQILIEARRQGKSKSDLLIEFGRFDRTLQTANIQIESTPEYLNAFQIDESLFDDILDQNVSYHNPRAKELDINSLRSIYCLRKGSSPLSVEKSKATFVTSNSGFAKAAWQYGQRHRQSREVSCVITDFSLANMAWLKAPMGAPDVPRTEILAFSYAALQPTKEILDRFMIQIDQLNELGQISARDHQLLRSSSVPYEELMQLTLGEESALTEETVKETLDRITREIKQEEYDKLINERRSHQNTQTALDSERQRMQSIQKKMYWRLRGMARFCSGVITLLLIGAVLLGVFKGKVLGSVAPLLGHVITFCSLLVLVITSLNLIFGTTIRNIHDRMSEWILNFVIKFVEREFGVDFDDLLRW